MYGSVSIYWTDRITTLLSITDKNQLPLLCPTQPPWPSEYRNVQQLTANGVAQSWYASGCPHESGRGEAKRHPMLPYTTNCIECGLLDLYHFILLDDLMVTKKLGRHPCLCTWLMNLKYCKSRNIHRVLLQLNNIQTQHLSGIDFFSSRIHPRCEVLTELCYFQTKTSAFVPPQSYS